MKYFLLTLAMVGLPQFGFGYGIENGERTNIGMNDQANEVTGQALQKEKKLCEKYTKLSQQPNGQQYKPKAKEHCEKAQQAAQQQAGLGQGMGDALKNLTSVLPALAQMMMANNGGSEDNFGIAPDGFVEEPETAVEALQKAGLSAAEARRYVKNNLAAKESLESGILGTAASGGGSGRGFGSMAASSSGSLSVEGSDVEKIPTDEGQGVDPSIRQELASLNAGGGSAGGGSGGEDGGSSPLEDFQLDSLPEFKLDKPESDDLGQDLPDDFTTLAGEKIGVTTDDIFQKLSRRYQYHKMTNGFITED